MSSIVTNFSYNNGVRIFIYYNKDYNKDKYSQYNVSFYILIFSIYCYEEAYVAFDKTIYAA